MSLGPAFDAKEQVRQAVDIVDLVGSYIQLRRQGRNFVGLCPWHDDSRPSFQVNPERQSFKCWVCDVGGDVFSFVMKAEGLEFREALELLAERAGVPLRSPAPHSAGAPDGSPEHAQPDKRTLFAVMAWAEEQFHRCLLAAPEAAPARQYLAERGISDESIRRFHLGFAPDRWDWLLLQARGASWQPSLLERAGLVIRREGGEGCYDRFRGRVMFSIRDARSRPVACGGRVLPQLADERSAKYINSPETPLFSKSRELYGLDVAREHFQESGGAIVMEGYTDCLMAHQHGVNNVVAVLGTALGDRHLELLRRYTDSITLVLDGDEAGRRRTNEILDTLIGLFEKNDVNLRILTLPDGVDPCDLIATQGIAAFRQLFAQAVDALEHKFRTVTNGLDILTDTHRATLAVEQVLATLAQIRPVASRASSKTLLREQQMLSRIARQFHLPEEQLRSRLVGLRRDARLPRRSPAGTPAVGDASSGASPAAGPEAPVARVADLPAWDRDLLELALLEPALLPRITAALEPTSIESDAARRIFLALCRQAQEHNEQFDFGRLLASFDDPNTKSLLVELDESSATKTSADRERWLEDLICVARRRRAQAEQRRELAAGRQNDQLAFEALARLQRERSPEELRQLERHRK